MLLEQFEIREIRNPGETDNRDPHAPPSRTFVPKRKRVFTGKGKGKIRDNAQYRHATQFFDHRYAGCKNRRISAELVDNDSPDERPDLFWEK